MVGLAHVIDAVRELRAMGATDVRVSGSDVRVRFGAVAQSADVQHARQDPPPEDLEEVDEDMLYHSSG